jgi:Ca-activated chloride channel homolog
MADHSSKSWLDAQLRETPLPEGLLVRLRAIAREAARQHGPPAGVGEEKLDRLLREVPLPAGLQERIRAALQEEALDEMLRGVEAPFGLAARVFVALREERMDDRVRDVPVPAGLADRIRAAVDADPEEAERVDVAVRTLPVPERVTARARIVPYLRSRPHPFFRGVAAALLFFLIGGGYLASVAAWTSLTRPAAPSPLAQMVVRLGGLEFEAPAPDEPAPSMESVTIAPAAETPAEDPQIVLRNIDEQPARGPAGEMAWALNHGLAADEKVISFQGELFGAQRAEDNFTGLETVRAPAPRGIELPMAPGYNRAEFFKLGVHPPVNPAADSEVSSVPVSTSTAAFDLAERLVRESRLPDSDEVRTEDFLAALEYNFPKPKEDAVRLLAAAGPSVFGERLNQVMPPRLLQVAAQAGPAKRRVSPATHLTVAIDVSADMRWNGRLEMAQRALSRMLEHLGPRDRLSLVAFHEEAAHEVEDASRDDREAILEAVARLAPQGERNLDAGLREALSLSLGAVGGDLSRRVVLLTSGPAGAPSVELEKSLRESKVRLDVIDLSRQDSSPESLESLAAAGGGKVHRGESADQIRWTLVEALLGESPVLASEASLTVEFNPKAVAAYRLIGHEPEFLGSSPGSGELRGLQAATALYEVWLLPNTIDDVAVATLTWRDPRTGELHDQSQRISRIQFAPSWAEAPTWLQAAAVAAHTAEVLRHSPFVYGDYRDHENTLVLADEVNPRLAEEESFRRLRALIERLNELKSRRMR